MKRWTIAAGESPRVYLINDGRDAVGEIVYTDTRRPEDARLIAAAPDLLAALKDAIETMNEHGLTPSRTAEDAIAKAEGVRS
jgi:hypothetical protein